METVNSSERLAALRTGIRLEIVTVGWMTLEGAIAIGAGVIAGSGLLIAFGLDSMIELLSGIVLLWRLSAEAKSAEVERIETVERRATMLSAILLALLCVYVAATVVVGLIMRIELESSLAGILVSLGAILIMPWLARAKRGVNARLDSPALRADIAESITCATMAATVLAGLAFNARWADGGQSTSPRRYSCIG